MVRHGGIDLARQFDEARMEVELLRLPREIKGIDWNAVPAEPGSRIERVKAKGFGLGRFDHFPDIYAHAQAELFQLVHQRDVDAAVDVLQKFGHLCRSRRRDRNGAVEDEAIEVPTEVACARIEAADNLGYVAPCYGIVAGILALRREGNIEQVVALHARPRGVQTTLVQTLENRHQNFFGRAGIGRALQDDQLTRTQMRCDRFCRVADVAEIRLVMFVQRRGNADDDSVYAGDVAVIRRGRETM